MDGRHAPADHACGAVMPAHSLPAVVSARPLCRDCPVRHGALFAHLEESDFSRLHRPIDNISLAAGDVLFNAGEPAASLYTVRSGLIKLERALPDGRLRIIALLRPGDTVGLSAYVQAQYDARAVALLDSALCRLPIAMLRDLEKNSPGLQAGLHQKWQEALSEAHQWLTELSFGPVHLRLARLLLKFPMHDGCITVCSRQDMGAMLGGVALETVSRAMSQFQRDGLLAPSDLVGRSYRVNLPALTELAQTERG